MEHQKIQDQIKIARAKLEEEIASHVQATREGFIAPSGTGAQNLPSLLSEKVSLDAQIAAVGKLVELAPGEARQVEVPLEWRTVAEWQDGGWTVAAGRYRFVLARDALAEGPAASVDLPLRRFGS